VPTLFEIVVVCAILWRLYNWTFALVTLTTIVLYVAFTFLVTDWRIRFRREMNTRNSEANTKAVDSLLNYETVKYFANEAHEAERYDLALRAYERAAVRSETTLALLNVGQGAIIAGGLIGVMILAAEGVAAGRMTVGDFVLVNSYLLQLYVPLNFLGVVYRNIKQSLTDLEQMMSLLKVAPEIEDRPQERRDRGRGATRPHPRFHRRSARRLRDRGRRAGAQTVGRRKAARRDRPGRAEGAEDPDFRRSHLGPRHQDRTRDPGEPRRG